MSEPLTTEIRVEGAEESKKSIMEFFEAYRSGKEDVRELNKAMREQYSSLYGMRRALSLVRTEWRMQHAVWVSGARVMRDVGRIGRTLTSMWQAYTLGMMRVEQAQRDVRSATMDVTTAQERYNRYLEVFGEDSVFAIKGYDDLQEAIDLEKDAMERAKRAQQDMNIGLIGLGLTFAAIPADIITAIAHLNEFKDVLLGIKGITGLAGLAPVAGVAAVGAGVAVMVAQAAREYPVVLEARKTVAETIGTEEAIGRQAFAIEVAEVLETAERYTTGATGWRGRQFGGEIFETGLYLLHRGEEVIPKTRAERLRETRAERLRERGVTVRHVTINQYIANVSSDVDIDRLSREAYRKLIRKLEAIR